ncbi:hypothetical protein SCANM63S_06630 [Streptomyces canarius]
MRRSARGATPRRVPPDAAPLPPTIEATCVPCPKWSSVLALSEKSTASVMRPARSGWLASTPVSSTATLTPWPSSPAFQAVGALICAVLRSSTAFTLPSSDTRGVSAARATPALPSGFNVFQKVPSRRSVTRSDRAWMLGRFREGVPGVLSATSRSAVAAAARAASAVTLAPSRDGSEETINGSAEVCASS